MNDLTYIIAVLCLAIGYVAGLLVSSVFGNRSKNRPEAGKPGTSIETGKGETGVVSVLPESKAGEIQPKVSPRPPKPLAQKSIVAQVDEILQTQISGTALAVRGVKLSEAPGDTVTVWIGLEQFPGIDAVPDAEVLAAIHQAVKTWEAQVRLF